MPDINAIGRFEENPSIILKLDIEHVVLKDGRTDADTQTVYHLCASTLVMLIIISLSGVNGAKGIVKKKLTYRRQLLVS